MRGLHRLSDYRQEVIVQLPEVRLLTQAGTKSLQGLRSVVLAAVEAAVDEGLYTMPDGVEERRDQERRSHDRELGPLSRKHYQGPLQQGDAAEVQEDEHGGQDRVDKRAVDNDVDVVEAVLEYRKGHRRRYREETDQEQRAPHRGPVERGPDARNDHGEREHGDAVGDPLDLLALIPPRPVETHVQSQYQRRRDGDQEQKRHPRKQVQQPRAPRYAHRVDDVHPFGEFAQRPGVQREGRDSQSGVG